MSIMIDKAKCKGCGMCTSVCPKIKRNSAKMTFLDARGTAPAVLRIFDKGFFL